MSYYNVFLELCELLDIYVFIRRGDQHCEFSRSAPEINITCLLVFVIALAIAKTAKSSLNNFVYVSVS